MEYYNSDYLHFSWAGQKDISLTRLSKKCRPCGQEANRTGSAHNDGSQTCRIGAQAKTLDLCIIIMIKDQQTHPDIQTY